MKYSSPPNLRNYYELVWDIARKIPSGRVATYGQIARLIPVPPGLNINSYLTLSPRWVGGAMANCPENVPWHRVINSQGKISQRKGEGTPLQKVLLENEGIAFDRNEKVDLKIYQWDGK